MRRLVAIAVLIAVGLTACTSGPGDSAPPTPGVTGGSNASAAPTAGSESADAAAPAAAGESPAESAVEQVRAMPFGQASVDAFAAVLTEAEVEIVDGFATSATAAVRVDRWQVENMAAEVANGGGVTGRTLDSWTPVPEGSPPLPFLVVAWMLEEQTPGAQFAHALYGDQDLSNAYLLRFPDGVLTLFLADATAGAPSVPSAASASPAALRAPRSTAGGGVRAVFAVAPADLLNTPCTTVSNFVHDAIKAVAEALTIKTSGGGFFGFLASIWNTAVRLASQFVSGLIDTLTKEVVARLVNVFNAVAVVEQISSVLIAWRAPLTPDPQSNRFGVTPEEVTGTVALQLQPHVLPLPPAVKDCADFVGVDISATAKGSAVTWRAVPTGRPDLASKTQADTALDASESATMTYTTGQEDPESLDDPERTGAYAIDTTIRRNDVERLRQFIQQTLVTQVPSALQSLVQSIAGPILASATGKLAELTDVHTTVQVPITYHGEYTQCRRSKIAPGTYLAEVEKDLRGAGGVTGHMSGTVTIVVDASGQTSGLIDVATDARGGGISSHSTEKAAISGATNAPVVTLMERIVDGKDLTSASTRTTPAMHGQCPPAIRWNLGSLAPGVKASPDGWNVVATVAP